MNCKANLATRLLFSSGKKARFKKTEELESTKIDQGRISLDPMVTPSVIKTERYYFTVSDGKVINARIEEEYER